LIHNAKTATASVTKSELKDMAIGRRKAWSSGAPVQLVLEPVGAPEMRWFSMVATGISDETLVAKMKQEVFKGELRRPVIVNSDKNCVNAVASDPGAVGVVSAETAKSLPDGVAVLAVQ
jgi:ABC-type phosphate transport system substrate-binding protein